MSHRSRAGKWFVVLAVALAGSSAAAQLRAVRVNTAGWEVLNLEAENVPSITGAPFTADATTEFTQTLSDGNRIERRFSTSMARDSHGRTRREQQMALVGGLAILQQPKSFAVAGGGGRGGRAVWTDAGAQGGPQSFVVITDPVAKVSYTLDEQQKEARTAPMQLQVKLLELNKLVANVVAKRADAEKAGIEGPVVEQLGTRQFEGVKATGVRTTNTIPAGEIGNLSPIKLVTERWFSDELGMAVQITRSDPRSGETVYRLTNIVRAEPPPDLFTVPSDYKIVDSGKKAIMIDHQKLLDAERAKSGGGRGKPETVR